MISFDNLFELKSSELGLEKPEDARVTLVSHAHSDHLPTAFRNNHLYCSETTRKIIELKKKLKETKVYRSPAIKNFDAGHILGSKMFLINKKLLYTGDFNTQKGFTGQAKPVKCDTLIMESTYGAPEYVFPEKEAIIDEIEDYIHKNKEVIITSLDSGFGKPQEICAALEKKGIGFRVSERIEKINELLGMKFKNNSPKADVIVSERNSALQYPLPYKRVCLTGWSASRNIFGMDKSFCFSSHSDYNGLLEFVEKCKPEKVYTHHGYASEFASALRKLGHNAMPLYSRKLFRKPMLQSTLLDYS